MKIYKYLLRDERTSKYKEAVQDFLWQLKVAHCKDRNDQFDCWGDDSIPFSEQMYKPEDEDDYPYLDNGIFIYKVVEYFEKIPTGNYMHVIVAGYDLPKKFLFDRTDKEGNVMEIRSKGKFETSALYGDIIDY